MDHSRMADGHLIANGRGKTFEGSVDNGVVLDVRLVTNGDGVHITSDHRIKPNGQLPTGSNVTHKTRATGHE
jgi:hypothetical protein